MEIDDSGALPSYEVCVGNNRFVIWISGGRILCHIILSNTSIGMYYFDFDTLRYDADYTERQQRA
jgi:hypothetical protein